LRLQNLQSTSSQSKGFAFSLEAAVGVAMILGGFFLLVLVDEPGGTYIASDTIIEDALFALENTGFIVQTLDSNSPTQSAQLIKDQILLFLPQGFDANVTVTSYAVDAQSCALQQNFSACFPDSNKIAGKSGSATEREVFFGKKYFLRKQPTGDCNISYVSLSEETQPPFYLPQNKKSTGAIFSDAFFDPGDINVNFDINASPSNAVICDQNITINLSVSVPEDVRKPIDLMLVMDRSGSMSWDGLLDISAGNDVLYNSGYAYIADGSAGLRVVDVSDPANPSLSGTYNSSGTAVGVFVSGSHAYLADSSNGVVSVNVSNPSLPSFADDYDPGTIVDVGGIESNHIFILDTASTDELISIDVSNPASLSESDQMNFNAVRKIAVESGYAFLTGRDSSGDNYDLHIVDVSDPSNMSYVTEVNMSDAQDIFVSGNYAYVADGSAGLKIVDITTPASASVIGTYNTPGTAYSVKVHDDGNAYVANSSSLQVINVSTPASPVFAKSYATPFSYTGLDVNGNWAFLVPGYSTSLTTFNIYDGPKLDQAKVSAQTFVDFNSWFLPPDQMGLVSYSDSNLLEQSLGTDVAGIKSDIGALVSSGSTNTAAGINNATSQLNSPNHNPIALKFQVLLTDGASNSYAQTIAAANTAASSSIIIYTIGFGGDVNPDELQDVADATGGEYYFAGDLNALQDVFALIALKVAELANDANISVPIITGSDVVDDGNGTVMDGNIVFNAGDINTTNPFFGSYVLNFPCSNQNICTTSAFTFPGPGAEFIYYGTDGNVHSVDFNDSVTLPFYSRDLTLSVVAGSVLGKDDISLDLLVTNTGELDANSTTLSLHLNDTNSPAVSSYSVPGLCSQQTPECTTYSEPFNGTRIASEGVVYAKINDDNSISECPVGNIKAVNCYGGPQVYIYAIEYAVWRSN